MKAMILAAGRGERLRPLTDKTPKPLLKAGGKPLIVHLIERLVAAGFDDIVINYAHLGEQFPEQLSDGAQWGANISYSPELDGGLETAGGIIRALPLLGNEPFLVINGDIWTDFDFASLRNKLADKALCHLVLVPNPPQHPNGDFHLTDDNQVEPVGDNQYTFSGIGLYRPALFAGYDDSKRPLKPLLLEAMAQSRASGELHNGEWSDIGTAERLKALDDQLKL
ncbi:N-acetylmuramate alpha-1-phosphate uridylyltransferase MurU [Methylophaga sp. OBS3]|uniref:N-acetylmuramate alpha-1-phosphate uridylyltransferase MurU n=1 Tax=Methylophaga sp. OBS3 TaxID=2991934 RepID=UPI00224EB007|nr:nucleotidyltransferase family protein [Methylophaga sp. OBS3]MCX4189280.1 nucleotidyltransferase family protein [Methylophaga sp. OBS3]